MKGKEVDIAHVDTIMMNGKLIVAKTINCLLVQEDLPLHRFPLHIVNTIGGYHYCSPNNATDFVSQTLRWAARRKQGKPDTSIMITNHEGIREMTMFAANQIIDAALQYMANNPGEGCPTANRVGNDCLDKLTKDRDAAINEERYEDAEKLKRRIAKLKVKK